MGASELTQETSQMNNGFAVDWWKSIYDDLVAEILLANRPAADIAAITSFLIRQLHLPANAIVFDQCCGIGTLSIALARQGFRVVGNDQSAAYIARAQRDAVAVPCTFFAADGTTFLPPQRCHAAFNWGTSFGNHLDDELNQQMLKRAFEALRPDGWFVLDYQHIPRVLRNFQQTLTYRHSTPEGEVLLLRESDVDWAAGALRQRWTFIRPDGRREERSSAVRLYWPHDMGRMLQACGFVDVIYLGDLQGGPLTLNSPRCMLAARRPS